jgi:hypothetical protein
VFDLSSVTFLDARALAAILHADWRGRRDGFDVVVVRPSALAGRVFTLTRAADELNVVDHAGQVDALAELIQFAGLVSGEIPTCVRCRVSPAALEGGGIVKSRVMLVSAQDGPICRGCATRWEQIGLGEAILAHLRRAHPRGDARIRALEEALADLRTAEPTEEL